MIDGVAIEIDEEGVVVRFDHLLPVVSSAVFGGGFGHARAVVNVHVPKAFRCDDAERVLEEITRRRGVASPYVGLLTAAWTEKAELATEVAGALTVSAVVTVGLGNPVAAGRAAPAVWAPSTINVIVIADAAPEPAALLNLAMTVTEVKTLALAEAGIRAPDGMPASGTSTDAVAIAATGRGPACRFGGPASELGAVAARAVKNALDTGIRRWKAEHP